MTSRKSFALLVIVVLAAMSVWRYERLDRATVMPSQLSDKPAANAPPPQRSAVAVSPAAPTAQAPKVDFTNAEVCSEALARPNGSEWQLVRVKSHGATEGSFFAYGLRTTKGQEPIFLGQGYDPVPNDETAEPGIDSDTFRVDWLRSGDLALASWNNWRSVKGQYTDRGYVVILLTPSGWKVLYRNSYCYVSTVENPAARYDHRTEQELKWDNTTSQLTISEVQSKHDHSRVLLPLSVRHQRADAYGRSQAFDVYESKVKLKTIWHCRIVAEKLVCVDGYRELDPGDGIFELADIPRFLNEDADAVPIMARVRKYNPSCKEGDTFEGEVLLDTGILTQVPDTKLYHDGSE